jgi:hypothetical protein
MKQAASFAGFWMTLDDKRDFLVIYGEIGGSYRLFNTEFEKDISPILTET